MVDAQGLLLEVQHDLRKIFVAGVIEVRATLFIEIVSLLDQAKTHLLNEEILGSLGVAGDRRDVVEAAKREVRRNLWKRLWPSFGGDLKLVAPADKIFFGLGPESGP